MHELGPDLVSEGPPLLPPTPSLVLFDMFDSPGPLADDDRRSLAETGHRAGASRRAGLSLLVGFAALVLAGCWSTPPSNAVFDYQIGGDYTTANTGATVVSRDWFAGTPLSTQGGYSICYVNAFQTQDNFDFVDRPDERDNWPANLVLSNLGDDPNWGGEYLIDISTAAKRSQAAAWVEQMVQGCADAGFNGVEFDNLDSWTRFDGTPVANQVPFGQAEAVAYATLITEHAHGLGLAVAQKNTTQLTLNQSRNIIGFDFAIAESCAVYNECDYFTNTFGDQVIAIEYSDASFATACAEIGDTVSVVRRDRNVTQPGSSTYVFDAC